MSQNLKGKAGIRAFLLRHIGEIVTTEQVRDASGATPLPTTASIGRQPSLHGITAERLG